MAERRDGCLVAAIDTSTDMLACAVGRLTPGSEGMHVEVVVSGDHLCRRHANVELIGTLDAALAQAGAGRRDVAALLVGRGPGSFTGVRIGISTAKGLACGGNLPLYGVSTLDATAWTAWRGGARGMVGVVADAMRGEVYPALYRLDDAGVTRLTERERVMKAADAATAWAERADAGELLLTGDGLKRYGKLFAEAGLARHVDEGLWHPTGEGLFLAGCAVRGAEQPADGQAAAGISQVRGGEAEGTLPDASVADGAPVPASEAHGEAHGAADGGAPSPVVVAALGHLGDGDPALVLPIYTRLSDAEENERRRLGLEQSAAGAVTGVAEELAGRHLQFRPMAAADAEAASILEGRCFAGSHHSAWTPAQFLSEFGTEAAVPRSWWVAHDDGELVGIAGGMVVEDDVQILDVAVDPGHRRRGIARKLLSHVSYDAQMLGCTTASLEVEAGNEPAIALYRALGFAEAGTRRGYYGPGADALVMTAPLPLVLPVDAASPEPTAAARRVWPRRPPERSAEERAELERRRLVLAIESSCDETAVAIMDQEGALLANQVSTQIDFHARFGGVVPEIASRKHVEVIAGVVDAALEEAARALGLAGGALAPDELAAVGVTQGPGLVGALVVGVAFAKGFAYAAGKPLITVNHLEGHLFANLLAQPDLEPPSSSRSSPVGTPCSCTCARGATTGCSARRSTTRWARRSTRWPRRWVWAIRAGPSSRASPRRAIRTRSSFPARSTARATTASHSRGSRRPWSTISSRRRLRAAPSTCPTWRRRSRRRCSTCSTRRPGEPCARRAPASTASVAAWRPTPTCASSCSASWAGRACA